VTELGNEARSLTPGARLELYDLDLTPINPSAGTVYFQSYTSAAPDVTVVFGGKSYLPLNIRADGFELRSDTLPRPRLSVVNITGAISALIENYDDLVGAIVTRRVTFERYLDGKPEADPLRQQISVWRISSKSRETKVLVEFELESSMDVQGVQLPGRTIQAHFCTWDYEGVECGYTHGGSGDETLMFKADDTSTLIPAEDVCGKRLTSCRKRFDPLNDNTPMPFGAFPSVARFVR
jgi:lambda family phage minor tail protein L